MAKKPAKKAAPVKKVAAKKAAPKKAAVKKAPVKKAAAKKVPEKKAAPKKAVKKVVKKAAPAKAAPVKKAPPEKKKVVKRVRAVKEVRLKAFWGVFNQSLRRVAIFDFNKRKDADKKAEEMTKSGKSPHFVQLVKEVIEG